uniref:polysaccharide biosynthesis protein n=1 Tax=Algoriphagus sp. TaxID=1872435 RepID=UPI0040476C9E
MRFLARISILPRWVILALDASILFFSMVFAYFVRFNFDLSRLIPEHVLGVSLSYTVGGILVMNYTKTYVGIVRHTGFQDGINVFKTILINFLLFFLLYLVKGEYLNANMIPPVSVLIIASLAAIFTLLFYRLFVKQTFMYLKQGTEPTLLRPTVIYGAGESGMIALEAAKRDTKSKLNVVAFLDEDPKKEGKNIDGKRIYRGIHALEDLVEELGVQELIISVKDLSIARKNEILDTCLRLNIKVSKVLPVDQWINGDMNAGALQEIRIEDLLSREEILLDKHEIAYYIKEKVVLVTGAAGSIGAELCRQMAFYKPSLLILLDAAESPLFDIQQEFKERYPSIVIKTVLADVRNRKRLNEIFKDNRPQLVFHAAAYKHVPLMEHYPEESIHTNVLGTKNMADLSAFYQVEKFVFVSTDKAVNPTNVMGATKRAAEMYVQSFNEYLENNHTKFHTRFITTRFGNVLGSNGSVVPLFKKQLANGGPLTVTHPDITRYFMTIPEACQLVLEAGIMGNGGEVYVFDMGSPVKIIDLAKRMIELSGKKVGEDIEIQFTGLREGEKLYEELLNDHERVQITHHPKIMIAQVKPNSYHKVRNQIELFAELIEKNNEYDMVRHLKVLVPEFISNSSRFETLDRVN